MQPMLSNLAVVFVKREKEIGCLHMQVVLGCMLAMYLHIRPAPVLPVQSRLPVVPHAAGGDRIGPGLIAEVCRAMWVGSCRPREHGFSLESVHWKDTCDNIDGPGKQ